MNIGREPAGARRIITDNLSTLHQCTSGSPEVTNGMTALITVAANNRSEILGVLIERGAEL
jgi:hypothetical protein